MSITPGEAKVATVTNERRGWLARITSIVAGMVGGEANRLSPSTDRSGRPHEAHPDEPARLDPRDDPQPGQPAPPQPGD